MTETDKSRRLFDVAALGEALIDFTGLGRSENGMQIFERHPGGAPANVVCAASRLGLKTAFIGKVGDDMHGGFLCAVLRENGVDVSGLVADPRVFTTLAFVELREDGERSFSFARKPGADTRLERRDVDVNAIKNSRVFHIGSLSLTDEPARSATLYALEEARMAGCIISYDPNYRELLWHSRESAARRMRSVLPLVDMVKLSEEETALLTGFQSPEEAAAALARDGIPLTVVTLGARGALVRTAEGSAVVPAQAVEVVDTTGAGDAFWGGFLYQMLQNTLHPRAVSLAQARAFAAFGNRVAGTCVGRRGGITAMPELADVVGARI